MKKSDKNASELHDAILTNIDKELALKKEAKKEYFKNWRKNNKDKVKKNNENFWKRQAEKLKSQNK